LSIPEKTKQNLKVKDFFIMKFLGYNSKDLEKQSKEANNWEMIKVE
jgi:hypothetical protein